MRMNTEKRFDIKNPCLERWGNMTPTEGGRHCEQCDTQVHDLRKFNFKQLNEFQQKHPNGACVMVDERRLKLTGLGRWRQRRLQRFAAAVILSFGTTLFAFLNEAQAVHVQEGIKSFIQQDNELLQRFQAQIIHPKTGKPWANAKFIIYADLKRVMAVYSDEEGRIDVSFELREEVRALMVKSATEEEGFYYSKTIDLKSHQLRDQCYELLLDKYLQERKATKRRKRSYRGKAICGFYAAGEKS